MKLSVIMPVYNENLDKLKRSIDSVVNTITIDYELIIINDGSDLYIDTFVNKYIEGKQNIIYIKKDNQGVSEARNFGIRISTGDYITFIDSDDIFLGRNLNEKLLDKKIDLIIYDMFFDNAQNNLNFKTLKKSGYNEKNSIIRRILYDDSLNSAVSKLYRSEVIKNNGLLFKSGMITGEDAMFVIEVSEKAKSFYYENCSIYQYDYDISHAYKRSVSFPFELLNDLTVLYKKKMNLFYKIEADLPSSEIKAIVSAICNDYTKKFFNTIVDILLAKDNFDAKKFTIQYNDNLSHNLSNINNYRKLAIKNKWFSLMKIYGYLRKIYLKLKY